MSSNDRFLRLERVEEIIGFRRTFIYSKVKSGDFPKPIQLGSRAIVWLESEVMAWMSSKITQRDALGTQEPKKVSLFQVG